MSSAAQDSEDVVVSQSKVPGQSRQMGRKTNTHLPLGLERRPADARADEGDPADAQLLSKPVFKARQRHFRVRRPMGIHGRRPRRPCEVNVLAQIQVPAIRQSKVITPDVRPGLLMEKAVRREGGNRRGHRHMAEPANTRVAVVDSSSAQPFHLSALAGTGMDVGEEEID